MIAAVVGLLILMAYAAALGAASVLTWRYASKRVRWVPGTITLVYYLLLYLFPHPVLVAVLNGKAYPATDALRSGMSTLALVTALFALGQLLREKDGR